MKTYNVGILGATGAVGREMMKILEERNFPIGELRLLASARSVGKKIAYKGEEIEVKLAEVGAFEGLEGVIEKRKGNQTMTRARVTQVLKEKRQEPQLQTVVLTTLLTLFG